MAKNGLIEVSLTLEEAKAVAHLITWGSFGIKADSSPVNNEHTLRKALDAAERGAEKIKAAMAVAGVPLG